MQAEPTRFSANVFLIGAQKAGTTYISSLCNQHPDVCVSEPKEPHFFTRNFVQGFDYYRQCFSDPESRIRIDASTTYSFLRPRRDLDVKDAPGLLDPVPQRIFEACPEARFIYILRDPVERAASAVRHGFRKDGVGNKEVSLGECLDRNPMVELGSRYSDQMERYLEYFPIESFLLINFSDIKRNPIEVVERIFKFLDLPSITAKESSSSSDRHASMVPNTLGRALGAIEFRKYMPQGLHKFLSRSAKSFMYSEQNIRFTDLDEVRDRFSSEAKSFATISGFSMDG
tara:strand:- start:567 stop:1424 length:858 start_codon:yes stop_codon:yes gene_type:complete